MIVCNSYCKMGQKDGLVCLPSSRSLRVVLYIHVHYKLHIKFH